METLVSLAREGSKEAKLDLIEACRPLIISSINRYYNFGDYEDLIQEGYLVLLESIESYDVRYGVYFLGYLKMKLRYYYMNKKLVREESLNSLDQNGREYLDRLESPLDLERELMESLESSLLKRRISSLSPREEEIISMFYFQDLSLGEIGYILGLSYQTVANIKYRAIKKLKVMVKK